MEEENSKYEPSRRSTLEKFTEVIKQLEAGKYTTNKICLETGYLDEEDAADRIGDEGAILLCKALKKNSHVKELELINQNITAVGAKAIAEIDNLEEVNLYLNGIGANGAVALVRGKFKVLNIEGTQIASEDEEGFITNHEEISILIRAIIENKTIKELNLSGNYIPDEYIAQLIAGNNTIEKLELYFTYLSDESLKYIDQNNSLLYLNLSQGYNGNNISDEGAKYISKNNSLKVLIMDNSRITDTGAQILSIHPTLKELSVRDSKITAEGLKYFLRSQLDNRSQLDKISVKNDEVRLDALREFYSLFERAKNLRIEEQQDYNDEDSHEIPLSGDDYHID